MPASRQRCSWAGGKMCVASKPKKSSCSTFSCVTVHARSRAWTAAVNARVRGHGLICPSEHVLASLDNKHDLEHTENRLVRHGRRHVRWQAEPAQQHIGASTIV